MCVIVPCRAQFSAKLFVRVSYEDTPPEVRSRPLRRGGIGLGLGEAGSAWD